MEDLLWTKSLLDRKKLASDSEGVSKSTLTVTEINDGCDDSGRENSLIAYSGSVNGNSFHSGNSGHECLKKVPRNYVQMRDPT